MEKVAIVSGGASGIGKATAIKLHEAGYHVFILDIKPLEHRAIHSVQCDLRESANIQTAIQSILKQTNRIDVLIHSAGMHLSATIENTSEQDFNQVMNTNLGSGFFLVKAVIGKMKEQQSGAIVLVSSDQAFIGKKNSAAYGASKAAISQLSKSLALDYAAFNIRVNSVCPGTIDTPLYRKAIENYSQRSGIPLATIEKEEAACQPLNRVGKPEEVAEAICFLVSDKASFITGSLLAVDGGYTAQ